ncbi:MAG: response regulator [Rickettsiales bacterium]|nr:response regulator [Rickettsiales bacterium]
MTKISKYAGKYLIILVDDEEISLKYFYKEFQSKFNIITTTNPEEVIEIIDSKPGEVALVISDQRMSYIKGVDLLTLIKAKDPEIIRVLTTAYASLEDNIEAINKGNVFAYLMKPWNIKYVEDVMNRALDEFGSRKNYLDLSSSIASEMRNPLETASRSAQVIRSKLANYESGQGVSASDLEEIVRVSDDLSSSAMRGNIIIDTILSSVRNKSVDTTSLKNYKISHVLNLMFSQFEFLDSEKDAIIINVEESEDFELKCNDILFGYALYILLKNIMETVSKEDITILAHKGIDGFNRIIISSDETFDIGVLDKSGLSFDFGRKVLENFGIVLFCEYGSVVMKLPKIGRVGVDDRERKILILASDDVGNKIQGSFGAFVEEFDSTVCGDVNLAIKLAKENDYDVILVENNSDFYGFGYQIREFDLLTAVLSLSKDGEQNLLGEVDDVIYYDNITNKDLRVIAKWGVTKVNSEDYDNIDFVGILKGKKILLADDEHFNLILGSKFFFDLGLEVKEVRDGLLAVGCFEGDEKYDLALIDIKMPNLSGIEVVKKIRQVEKDEGLNSMPVVAFTADNAKVRVREILKAGFDDYFIKSTKYNDLAKMMSIYLG